MKPNVSQLLAELEHIKWNHHAALVRDMLDKQEALMCQVHAMKHAIDTARMASGKTNVKPAGQAWMEVYAVPVSYWEAVIHAANLNGESER